MNDERECYTRQHGRLVYIRHVSRHVLGYGPQDGRHCAIAGSDHDRVGSRDVPERTRDLRAAPSEGMFSAVPNSETKRNGIGSRAASVAKRAMGYGAMTAAGWLICHEVVSTAGWLCLYHWFVSSFAFFFLVSRFVLCVYVQARRLQKAMTSAPRFVACDGESGPVQTGERQTGCTWCLENGGARNYSMGSTVQPHA